LQTQKSRLSSQESKFLQKVPKPNWKIMYPNFIPLNELHYFDVTVRDGPGGFISIFACDQNKKELCANA
jgi:hypothetical protein